MALAWDKADIGITPLPKSFQVYSNALYSHSYDSLLIRQESREQRHDDDFPEGGVKAWSVVAGAWCCIFVSVGWLACMGAFQAYYLSNQLQEYSQSIIGWIPSTQACFLFVFAPLFGHVFDSYGPPPLLIGGTVLHVFGLLMLSISTKYYQVFLSQAVCSGVGGGALYCVAGLSINTWFQRRRGFASGLASSAASVGGAIGTAIIPSLFSTIGFGGALRAITFAYLGLLAFALVTVRSRSKHVSPEVRVSEPIRARKEWRGGALSLAGFFIFLGVYLPYNFLVVESRASGISITSTNSLLIILNASGVLGRIAPAWACDRLGRFNVTIVSAFASALLVFALWISVEGIKARIIFASLYGVFSASLLAIIPTLMIQVSSDARRLGPYTGAASLAISPGCLITQPIGGALVLEGTHSPYLPLKLFCGSALCVGGVFLVFARASYLREKLARPDGELQQINFRIILS